jgi:hypothetical protein
MTVEYLQMLLATAEQMLATASALPESAGRDDALQMVRAYLSNIALLMNATELSLRAKPNENR